MLKPILLRLPERMSRVQTCFAILTIALFFAGFQIGKPRVDLARARHVTAILDSWKDKTFGKAAVQDLESSDSLNYLFNISHLELRREVAEKFLDPGPLNFSSFLSDVPSIEHALVLPRSAEENFKLNSSKEVFKKLIFSD